MSKLIDTDKLLEKLYIRECLTQEVSEIIDELPNEINLQSMCEQIEDFGKYKGMLAKHDENTDWENYVPIRAVKEIIKGKGLEENYEEVLTKINKKEKI